VADDMMVEVDNQEPGPDDVADELREVVETHDDAEEEVHDRLDDVLARLDELSRKVDELHRQEEREERRDERHEEEHREHAEEERELERVERLDDELPPPIDVTVEEPPKKERTKARSRSGFRANRRN